MANRTNSVENNSSPRTKMIYMRDGSEDSESISKHHQTVDGVTGERNGSNQADKWTGVLSGDTSDVNKS